MKDEPIYIIVYRQGARVPEVIDLTSEYEGEKSPAIGFEVESERDEEEEACVQNGCNIRHVLVVDGDQYGACVGTFYPRFYMVWILLRQSSSIQNDYNNYRAGMLFCHFVVIHFS